MRVMKKNNNPENKKEMKSCSFHIFKHLRTKSSQVVTNVEDDPQKNNVFHITQFFI